MTDIQHADEMLMEILHLAKKLHAEVDSWDEKYQKQWCKSGRGFIVGIRHDELEEKEFGSASIANFVDRVTEAYLEKAMFSRADHADKDTDDECHHDDDAEHVLQQIDTI